MKTKLKFSKQILSILLCLAMLMSYVPMTAVAAYDYDKETKFSFRITNLVMEWNGERYEWGTSGSAFYDQSLTKISDGEFQYKFKAALSTGGGTWWSDFHTITFDGVNCDVDYLKTFDLTDSTNAGGHTMTWTYTVEVSKYKGHVYGSWSDNGDGTHSRTCDIDSTHKETADHNYAAATCTAPQTCKSCGATTGEPVADAHGWNAATCVLPATCRHCGLTDGDVLGHEIVAASFGKPAACKRCGATDINVTVLEKALINTNVNLPSKAIKSDNSGYYDITWSVVSAGDTGAVVNGNTLKATNSGNVTIRATTDIGSKDYDVIFSGSENVDISFGSVAISKKNDTQLTVTFVGFEGGSKVYEVGEPIVITGSTTSNNITVNSGVADIHLNNVTISGGFNNIEIEPGAEANITLHGTNSLSVTGRVYSVIAVPSGANVTFDGSGTLNATASGDYAAIGGSIKEPNAGTIIINGGTIVANNAYANDEGGAGIGGGTGGSSGTIIINGGNVTATGGGLAAGIGGGDEGDSGNVTINGGYVTATGGRGAAGIGGGYGGDSGNVTINGGYVTATGGQNAAGIGGGQTGSVDTITINGGTIIAKGHGGKNNNYAAAGIGGGYKGNGGTIIITGGNINATPGTSKAAAIGNGQKGSAGTVKDANGNGVSLNTFTLEGAANGTVVTGIESSVDYGITGVQTLDDKKLYFYLPNDAGVSSLTAGDEEYNCTADNKTFYSSHNWDNGICTRCNKICEHEGQKDTCGVCGKILHTHSWEYNSDGTTITATCNAEGCDNTNGGSVTLVAPTELTYNGTAKEATLEFDNWQLGDDAKPTISYNDTDKVAVTNEDIVATITLGGESASVTYQVKPASINGATVSADDVNYTGSAQTPDVSVVLNGKTLVKDTDYTVSYSDNTSAGTATVTVTGKGNYDGTATGTFTITDTVEPTGAILIKDNTWLKFLNNITFGLFFKENVDVIVTADGTGSAVDKVEYLFSTTALNEDNLPADGWITVEGDDGTYKFAITAQNKGAVYVRITDAYGNVAVINSDGIVVYTDSNVKMDTVYFTYQSTEDVVVELELNGNTVKNVLFNGHEITNHWSVDGNNLTLDADYLGRLVVLDNGAGYPVTVFFNPLGVETNKVELKDEFTLIIQKTNGSVTNISNVSKTYDGTSVAAPTFEQLGNGVATIEYKVKDADDSTYTTTAPKNAGDYVVRVSVAESANHKAAFATAEFSIGKAELTGVSVQQNGELTYNGNALTPSVIEKATAENNQAVTFTYSAEKNGSYGTMPTFTKAGTYIVYYTASAPNHNDATGSFAVTVDKAIVTEPTIASKPYTGSAQTADIVDTDLYTVEQNNGGTAQGSYDVVLELKDAANYKWATTDNAEVTVKFVISAAENTWNVAPSISGWTYGENANDPTYEAKFGDDTVKVTYTGKANDGSDYNGETAPTKAGNYTATFTVEGTADYSGLSESVDFTIAKATYDMSSAKWNYTDAFKYDGKEHKVEVVGLPAGVTVGGYNGNTATVVGDYTAKVTLTYDANNYNAPSVADLNWTVENNWTPTEYAVNGSGWMNQDFVITANDGYKVSLDDKANGTWSDTLTYSAETDNGSVTFYLKNEADGTISLAKTVTYKLDKTAPTGTVEFVDRTGWQEFVNTITFGLFYKDEVTVKITSADNLSDVAKVEYCASNEGLTLNEVKAIDNWTSYTDSFGVSVEDTKKFVYYVRITDNAGNVTFLSTDGAEYDITAPVISGIENDATYYTTQKVTVTDKNLGTVTLNGNEVTGAVTLDGNKDVTYTIVATDMAGNSTTVIVTMKPISDLSAPIDALNKDNVNSGDEQAVDGVKAAVVAVDTTNATDDEKAALKEIADKAAELEKVIDDTKAELARIEEELNKHNGATVNSDDAEALKQLAEDMTALLDGDNLTDAERTALTEDAGKVADMQKTVADTTAENKRISDAVDSYDLATVTSADKTDLEQLLADIEKQLESTNLTEEEISELNGDKKAVEDLLTKIKGTDELIDKLIEDVNEYSDDTVKSTDKDAIEQIIEDIDALLETENLTEEEKKALEDAKDKAEGLLETIDEATKATDTENTEKVKDVTSENVTPEDKTDLEKAKDDLEKALEDYGDNYTDDEKKAIEDEIKRIDDALEVIENVEEVEDKINALPENITKDDTDDVDAAKKAYDELSDYEKTLVDPEAKKKLDEAIKAAEEVNKPADTNSPQTGDSSHMGLWFTLMLGSLTALFAIFFGTKKKKAEDK